MTQNSTLAPHETLELRQLLSSDVLGAKKLQASITMVQDNELKSYMERCLSSKKNNINSIQSFVEGIENQKGGMQ
jgi:hypothetical protein